MRKMVLSLLLLLLTVGLVFSTGSSESKANKNATLKVQEPYGLDMTNSSAQAFDALLREYEAANPGVKIEYLSPPGSIHDNQTYNPWMQARMLAKDAPDVLNVHQVLVTEFYGQGWFMPIEGMLKKNSPYIGGKAWGSSLDQGMINFFTMNDKHSYGVPVDGVGVAVFYNKAMFQKAGITSEPKTWTEFMTACEKLKKAGFVAWNGGNGDKPRMALHWLTTPINGQLMQSEQMKSLRKKIDNNGDGSLTAPEYAIAFRAGIWPAWDVYLDVLDAYKSLTPYMPAGWEGDVPSFDTNFASGSVAMSIEGSWTIPNLAQMGLDFEFGVFQVPLLTKAESSYATGTLCRHTGPWGYTLGIPGYLKNDPERLKRVEDLVMFLTSPTSMQKVANASSSYLPFVSGVKAGGNQEKLMAVFSNPAAVPIVDVPSWLNLPYDNEGEVAGRLVFEQYLANKINADQLKEKFTAVMEASVQRQLMANPGFLNK